MRRLALPDKPPTSSIDPLYPLWSDDLLYEWYLLTLDDKSYGATLKDDKIEGTNLPSSGDPIMDAAIAEHYKQVKRG